MSHWYTHDRLASQHRADLDREADRDVLARSVRGGSGSRGWIHRVRLTLATIRRRRLEAELRVARRQVDTLERALQTIRAD
ncbi:MAG TPA: hypothetical protein VGQ02_03055 [Candidatus Limnocylindrales bacterium]|jgi:hypothetical protein|nr:hypothetical protein [Candidatus Limnocylindrales bacterium]